MPPPKEKLMGRFVFVVLLALGVAVAATSATAAPGPAPARETELQRALDEVVAAGVPGAVALVRVDGRTIRFASGDGNVEPKTPMRTGDRFRVGSITKTFVATVVLQLVGERKLSLDDPVERWLPGVVPNGKRITVRRLLNHTTGLFDYGGDRKWLAAAYRDPMRNWAPREIVAVATSHKPHFAPGAGWSYSNTNYFVLGLVVEAATKHSLATELRRRIFTPLRLRDTSFPTKPRIAGRHAHGYFLRPPEDVSDGSPSVVWAAGAVVSTADDLARFYRALLGGRLLSPQLLREMETTVTPAPGFSYGLGLQKLRGPCGTFWGHSGGSPGYAVDALNSKDGQRQVLVFVNATDPLTPSLKNFRSFNAPERAGRAIERFIEAAYCGTAATPLERSLDELVAAGAPGALALVRDGNRTTRVTSGYGNLAGKTPMRATDRFRIGSVTKTFVATVVLELVAEGKLSLDDTVERRLPGLVPNGRRITVRQLLNMTAGLFDYLMDGDPTVMKPYLAGNLTYTWKPRRLVEIAVSHEPKFAPGAGWSYCNTCYIVLGLIVEGATGRPLATELRRRIFAPLHLRGTTFDAAPRIAGRYAHGYELDGGRLVDVSVFSPSYGWAAGAIVSTADDLARFYRALLGGRLLRHDLLRAMETTADARSLAPGVRYGLGLARVPMPCGVAWGHAGGIAGYGAWTLSSKDGRRQIVLLATREESLSTRASVVLERAVATAYCKEKP
jgi:D-alanyl-D-alanine carboxypeptidase